MGAAHRPGTGERKPAPRLTVPPWNVFDNEWPKLEDCHTDAAERKIATMIRNYIAGYIRKARQL